MFDKEGPGKFEQKVTQDQDSQKQKLNIRSKQTIEEAKAIDEIGEVKGIEVSKESLKPSSLINKSERKTKKFDVETRRRETLLQTIDEYFIDEKFYKYEGELIERLYKNKLDEISFSEIKNEFLPEEFEADFLDRLKRKYLSEHKKEYSKEKISLLKEFYSIYLDVVEKLKKQESYNKQDLFQNLQNKFQSKYSFLSKEDSMVLALLCVNERLKRSKTLENLQRIFDLPDELAKEFYDHFIYAYRILAEDNYKTEKNFKERNNLFYDNYGFRAEHTVASTIGYLLGFNVVLSSDFDDWKNHLDFIIELDDDMGEYLAIDVTLENIYSERMEAKSAREGQEVVPEFFYTDSYDEINDSFLVKRYKEAMPLLTIDWNFINWDGDKSYLVNLVETYLFLKRYPAKFEKYVDLFNAKEMEQIMLVGEEYMRHVLKKILTYFLEELVFEAGTDNAEFDYVLDNVLDKEFLTEFLDNYQKMELNERAEMFLSNIQYLLNAPMVRDCFE